MQYVICMKSIDMVIYNAMLLNSIYMQFVLLYSGFSYFLTEFYIIHLYNANFLLWKYNNLVRKYFRQHIKNIVYFIDL